MQFTQLDLISLMALVERWRPETHTFHLPSGEPRVTLQDVEVIIRLSIDGRPVIGTTYLRWGTLVEHLLGSWERGEGITLVWRGYGCNFLDQYKRGLYKFRLTSKQECVDEKKTDGDVRYREHGWWSEILPDILWLLDEFIRAQWACSALCAVAGAWRGDWRVALEFE
ncbi:hypothetical protein Vadar_025203 [Vaccinium darrowii]|uniref:Uncharacterized protein n=1 Tax=Vaccinium darrowii TaxID=229202 RepID=A0ACB7XT54_9ERIC|nr:hypothetical protein Vadar_025203 [Vaccinium darrowii]